MTALIQIAHPNEAAIGKWRTVDRIPVIENTRDHLASPIYNVERLLCVRVITEKDQDIFYTGIYGETDLVNVYADSDVMRKYSFDYHDGAKEFMESQSSWIECWRLNPYPEALMHAVFPMFSTIRLGLVLAACVKDSLEHVQEVDLSTMELAYRLVETVIDWAKDRADSGEVYKLYLDISDISNRIQISHYGSRNTLYAVSSLGRFATASGKEEYAMECIQLCCGSRMSSVSSDYDDRAFEIADIIRKQIPFHEIAEKLVQ